MNVENLKTELQQVLNSDVTLRKEYVELKRSLSDYRNQLIERDEDCKRLQVTIDVLNTKMVVMERDNLNYKSELTSFKELRENIKAQLHAKQEEIQSHLNEIANLQSRLDGISAEYEAKIQDVKNASAEEVLAVKTELTKHIEELRSNTHYREIGVRDEYEQKINALTVSMAEKEADVAAQHESEIISLKESYTRQIEELKATYETQIAESKDSSENYVETLTNEYEGKLFRLQDTYAKSQLESTTAFANQINHLQNTIESQKAEFEQLLTSKIQELTAASTSKEQNLISEYETQINSLLALAGTDMDALKAEYEERLSNTLIHSNEQNTKLTEELNKFVLENEHFKEKIKELVYHIDEQNTRIEDLSRELEIKAGELSAKNEEHATLTNEFESFKASQQQSQSEQVQNLNSELSKLTETIAELKSEIETKTNTIAELSSSVSSKSAELGYSKSEIERLNAEISKSLEEVSEKEGNFESFRSELETLTQQQLEAQKVEYSKLLAENTNLINEIDLAQDKVEAQESEIALLKAELEEAGSHVEGRVSDLKETLTAKNFEITTLTANNAALTNEIGQLKLEVENWESKYNALSTENAGLLLQIEELTSITSGFKTEIEGLNSKIASYDETIASLKGKQKNAEQDEYIDRLFKQIDALNDERLGLLNEKEEMANQLLKMNEVVSNISQNIDSQSIDVTGLNNHRKNIILAKSSGGVTDEKTAMKKQINELVREIDKCIALLSA